MFKYRWERSNSFSHFGSRPNDRRLCELAGVFVSYVLEWGKHSVEYISFESFSFEIIWFWHFHSWAVYVLGALCLSFPSKMSNFLWKNISPWESIAIASKMVTLVEMTTNNSISRLETVKSFPVQLIQSHSTQTSFIVSLSSGESLRSLVEKHYLSLVRSLSLSPSLALTSKQ